MMNIMQNLTQLFEVGQKVTYRNKDFDAVKRDIPCIVKETYSDHMIITDLETNTDLFIKEGFNLDWVYPEPEREKIHAIVKEKHITCYGSPVRFDIGAHVWDYKEDIFEQNGHKMMLAHDELSGQIIGFLPLYKTNANIE